MTALPIGLEEVAFHTTVGGSELPSVSWTASTSEAGYPPSNLGDDNTSTAWISAPVDASAQWVAADLGVAQPIVEIAVTVIGIEGPSYPPTSFEIDYSDDGSTWTYLESFSGLSWSVGETQTFGVGGAALLYDRVLECGTGEFNVSAPFTAHRYWRLADLIGGGAPNIVISAVTLFSDGVALSGTWSASGYLVWYEAPGNLSQGVANSEVNSWVSDGDPTDGQAWVEIDLGSATAFDQLTVIASTDVPTGAPVSFALQYSDDGSTWATLESYSGLSWSAGQSQTFTPNGGANLYYTQISETGEFTVTGVGATLSHVRVLNAGTGSFALAGVAATLDQVDTLVAGAGAFTVTGVGATLSHNRILPTGVGAFNLSGVGAALEFTQVLDAGIGGFYVTGVAASLLQTHVLSAGTGAFTVTGNNVPSPPRVLSTSAVAFSISSVGASLGPIRILSVGTGAFSLTGVNAQLLHDYQAAPSAGAFTLTGVGATFGYNRAIAPPPGAFTVTGVGANLQVSHILDAGTGVFELAGVGSTGSAINGPPVMPTTSGAFAVTGSNAALSYTHVLYAGVGAFALTGVTATLAREYPMLGGSWGTFVVNGVSATLLRFHQISVSAGAFTVTGVPAVMTRVRVLVCGTGDFSLTGVSDTLTHVRVLVCNPGAFDVSSVGAQLNMGAVMTCGTGAFSIAGEAAALTHVWPTTGGAFTVTGVAAGLLRLRILRAGTGQFVVGGSQIGQLVPPATASFVWTAQAAAAMEWETPEVDVEFGAPSARAGWGAPEANVGWST